MIACEKGRVGIHDISEIARSGHNYFDDGNTPGYSFLHFSAEYGLDKITEIILKAMR